MSRPSAGDLVRPPFLCLAILLAMSTITLCPAQENNQPTWQLETRDAGWQARDSQGEVVYNEQLWIFGGWFNSFEAPPRDVWNSSNGKDWQLVTKAAPWIHSDLPMSAVFQNRMWMMGGWYNGRLPGHSATSSVWSSTDGKNWKQETEAAGWSPRLAAATVVFKDRLWILGGTENYYFGDESSLKNDVWSTSNGRDWEQMTADAGWAPRSYHQAAVLNDRIYVFGGGNYVPEYVGYNDVWSSADGVTWRRETEAAPWRARLWFSAVTYRDHMWVIGGWSNNPSTNLGDVWYSKDGQHWEEFKTPTVWKERHEHSALVFQDRIWVAGGHARPLNSEVWSLHIPEDWFQK